MSDLTDDEILARAEAIKAQKAHRNTISRIMAARRIEIVTYGNSHLPDVRLTVEPGPMLAAFLFEHFGIKTPDFRIKTATPTDGQTGPRPGY